MMVTILFMAMVIIDGVFFIGKVSEWWFHILYLLTLYYFFKATRVQHLSFKESTEIVLEMTKSARTDSERFNSILVIKFRQNDKTF